MNRSIQLLLTVLTLNLLPSAAGCASSPPARIVRASDLATAPLTRGEPVIIEFQPGDVIPLEVRVDGPLVATSAAPAPILLKVARRFYLRLDDEGMSTSLDGKTFGDPSEPGAFSFGVGASKASGVAATLGIRTPTPREPGG